MNRLETECLSKVPISKEAVQVVYDLRENASSNPDVLRTWVKNLCLSHERLRAELDGVLSEISEMLAVETLHRRKCWECKTTNWHADSRTPYVLCPKCGSQDTRRIT